MGVLNRISRARRAKWEDSTPDVAQEFSRALKMQRQNVRGLQLVSTSPSILNRRKIGQSMNRTAGVHWDRLFTIGIFSLIAVSSIILFQTDIRFEERGRTL